MSKNNNRIITYYIYKITNILNGKTYIGQRQCPFNKTPWTDVSYMGKGKLILLAENKYGIENFTKDILAICYSEKIVDILETEYIRLHKEIGKAEYNIAGGGQTRCREFMTESQRLLCNENISKGIRNSEKWRKSMRSEKRRKKLSDSHKGKTPWCKGMKMPDEFREHVSISIKRMYASPKGDEVKAKIKFARQFQTITEETKKKISEANKGKKMSDATKEKLRKANLGKFVSEETKSKIRAARAKQVFSEESLKKLKESQRKYWDSPEGFEMKRRISEQSKNRKMPKGLHWYNDGRTCVKAKECPEGFVPGRIGNFACSEEAKRKKSEWWKNLSQDEREAYKKNHSEGLKGHVCSMETREKISAAKKGKPGRAQSEESKAKISAALKGRKREISYA